MKEIDIVLIKDTIAMVLIRDAVLGLQVGSQWFECPCHGSPYTRVGEKKGGPAPRGMDLFPVAIEGGTVTVDTGLVIQGMPIGTNISGQEAEGPHCVTSAEG